jgi:hypothetical protein
MALFQAEGDRMVRKIMAELQKVTEAQLGSLATSLGAQLQEQLEKSISVVTKSFVWGISIFLAIYIWRQLEEEKRARELHARNMEPRLCEKCQSKCK